MKECGHVTYSAFKGRVKTKSCSKTQRDCTSFHLHYCDIKEKTSLFRFHGWLLSNIFCSYTYYDEEGVFAESQFVFDLELPLDFKPTVGDKEVQDFYLLPIEKVSAADILSCFSVKWQVTLKDQRVRYGENVRGVFCVLRWRSCWLPMTSNRTLPWWS